MTRFGTATGHGKYSFSFETDDHEHFEYMQAAARHCVDGTVPFIQLLGELTMVKAENERLAKEIKMYASVNDSLIEDNEAYQVKLKQTEALWEATAQTLHDEIVQLREELADERDRFDRLSDFEVAEAKQYAAVKAEAERAKLAYNVTMNLLEQEGYPVTLLFIKTADIVAAEERKAKHGQH